MALPPAFLDELRARLPVSQVVGQRVALTRGHRGEFKACCPFHKEKTPSFTVNDPKGFFHCFGCGAHGDVIAFVMQHDRLSFMEAVEALAGQAGLEVPKASVEERRRFERQRSLGEVLEAACAFFEAELHGPAGRAARAYLDGRGLDAATIRRFRLGFAPADGTRLLRHLAKAGFEAALVEEAGLLRRPEDGRDAFAFFRNRIVFPVGDRRDRIVGFGARLMEGDGPKYINSPDGPLFHKGRLLYGLARATQAAGHGQPVIVAEGYMDVIALVRAGFEAAVAPLGTALTEDQIEALWRMTPVPILCFDGDEAGRRAAFRAMDRILPRLRPDHSARIAFLPEGEDPDSLVRAGGSAAMATVLEGARPLAELLFERETTLHDTATPEGRAGLRAALDARAGAITDPMVAAAYRQDLRARFDEAFPWRPGRQADGGRGGDGGPATWRRRQPGAAVPAGPRPRGLLDDRDDRVAVALLMVTLANHPALFDSVGERLAMMPVEDEATDAARQRFLDRLAEAFRDAPQGLDPGQLRPHLTSPQGAGLSPTLLDRIERKWRFAARAASDEAAREGWEAVMSGLEARARRREVAAAARALVEGGTEQDVLRWKRLHPESDLASGGEGG